VVALRFKISYKIEIFLRLVIFTRFIPYICDSIILAYARESVVPCLMCIKAQVYGMICW
jgi:hypothetical protein